MEDTLLRLGRFRTKSSRDEKDFEGEENARKRHVGRKTLSDPGKLPEDAEKAGFVAVHDGRHQRSQVSARADRQQDHSDHRLKIKITFCI